MPRPKLPSGKRRTHRVTLAFTPAEFKAVRALAGSQPIAKEIRALLKKAGANETAVVDSAPR